MQQNIPVVSFVGKSNTGKTTLLIKLIPELKARGHKIAVVKHSHQEMIEIDQPGKDTYRMKIAGADLVIISARKRLAIIQDCEEELTLEEIHQRWVKDVDLLITEGYKKDKYPKIEVYSAERHPDLLCTTKDNLIAVVSDTLIQKDVPCFLRDDIQSIVDFLEAQFLRQD